jgi:hypothetical protein
MVRASRNPLSATAGAATPPGRRHARPLRFRRAAGDLERAKPRAVIVDVRGDDQLVCPGAAHEVGEALANSAGAADERAGERLREHGLLEGLELGLEALQRWRQGGTSRAPEARGSRGEGRSRIIPRADASAIATSSGALCTKSLRGTVGSRPSILRSTRRNTAAATGATSSSVGDETVLWKTLQAY